MSFNDVKRQCDRFLVIRGLNHSFRQGVTTGFMQAKAEKKLAEQEIEKNPRPQKTEVDRQADRARRNLMRRAKRAADGLPEEEKAAQKKARMQKYWANRTPEEIAIYKARRKANAKSPEQKKADKAASQQRWRENKKSRAIK